MSLPKLNEIQTLKYEGVIAESELFKVLTSTHNDKTPGNESLIKEF